MNYIGSKKTVTYMKIFLKPNPPEQTKNPKQKPNKPKHLSRHFQSRS